MPKRAQTRRELSEAGKARWSAEDAREVLAAQEASGESVAGFARRHGRDRCFVEVLRAMGEKRRDVIRILQGDFHDMEWWSEDG